LKNKTKTMSYTIKEIFKTLQGEGAQAGRTAVFCRFTGCNLWSGREDDRTKAVCQFCDTDFVGTDGEGGGRYADAQALLDMIENKWVEGIKPAQTQHNRLIVFTGGEPLLQLDDAIIDEAHKRGFSCAVETNGTLDAPQSLDWICVSPKAGVSLVQQSGHELKLVYPQSGQSPQDLAHLDFQHFWLQPMDGPLREAYTQQAILYCLNHPQWRLSVQTHKMIGLR
jgi:7-carboxy-7-deazaguanine synthase